MISINQIVINLQQVAKGDQLILVGVKPTKEFKDGKQTERIIGYSYSVVFPQNRYEAAVIKVDETKPVITQEELEAKGGSVKVKIKNFEGRFYQNSNKDVLFTAKAAGIEVLP
jgi:hypothetical protein